MREATSPPPEVHYQNLQRAASPDPQTNHHNGRLPPLALGRNGNGSVSPSNNRSVAMSPNRPGSPPAATGMQHLSPSPHRMAQHDEEDVVQGQNEASLNSSPTPLQIRNNGGGNSQHQVSMSGNRSPNSMIQRRHKFRHQGSSRSTGSAASTDDTSPCISRGEHDA